MDYSFLRRTYLAGFLILVASLFYYQILNGQYYVKRAEHNFLRAIPQRSLRGSILDRNGELLAFDRASFNIAVIPYQIRKKKESLFSAVARVLKCSESQIERNYKRGLENYFSPVNIVFDVDKATALRAFENFPDDVIINPQPQRFYPYGYECAHLLGYVKDAAAFYANLKQYGYAPSERVGFSGIEQYYDSYLRGEDGGDLIEVNARGSVVGFLGESRAQKGNDITLTIDARIQKCAYEALKSFKGALILMDSENGEVLALVSTPSYDINSFITGKDVGRFLLDKANPMQNRAVQSRFPLGSTFKPIVAAAALEEKKINPATTFLCKGSLRVGNKDFRCENVHGNENLYDGMAHSCNVYFYNVGLALGKDLLWSWARKYGLSAPTLIDLPHEKRGFSPTIDRDLAGRWFVGDTVNLSIGQGYMQATPLEIVVALTSFGNGGYLVKPHILKKIGAVESGVMSKTPVELSQKNREIVARAMRGVVQRSDGTSHILNDLNLKIAGKTGTAQNPGRPHGWFTGYFPAEKPRYSICVLLENAGSSYEALKVTHEFLAALKAQKILDVAQVN